MSWRLGIDIGGTFTDFALIGADGRRAIHKQLTTPADPSQAVLDGTAALLKAEGVQIGKVDFLGEVPIDPRIAEDGDVGQPIVVSRPDSPSSEALCKIAGEVARKVAMLAVESPPIADANITWVN